ncbi:MAG: glucose-1-phosphate thymidylyltransferase, partial [Sphingobacteriia bacterium 32-37-4]
IGADFIGDDDVALILGDNIFHGDSVNNILPTVKNPEGGVVFAYHVSDPQRYGVVEFDANLKALSIEEKPLVPKSNFAVPGLYFYDNSVVEIAKNIKPSARGEYEITDVNRVYLEKGTLQVGIMNRGTAWLDTGTFDSFADACEFVRVIEKRQSQKVGCIEEVAYRMGFIDRAQLMLLGEKYAKSGYGEYLKRLKVL